MTAKLQHEEGWVCPVCKLARGADGDDPCIAGLPGVLYACCGHGHGGHRAYLYFANGVRLGINVRDISYDGDVRPRIVMPTNAR